MIIIIDDTKESELLLLISALLDLAEQSPGAEKVPLINNRLETILFPEQIKNETAIRPM